MNDSSSKFKNLLLLGQEDLLNPVQPRMHIFTVLIQYELVTSQLFSLHFHVLYYIYFYNQQSTSNALNEQRVCKLAFTSP